MRKNTVKGWLQLARPPVGALKWEKVEFDESVKLAIKSLEKQIPVKPCGDGYNEPWTCEECAYDLSMHIVNTDVKAKFCPECGQAIDWNIN